MTKETVASKACRAWGVAVALAREIGYRNITLANLAERMGVPRTWAVNHLRMTDIWTYLRDNSERLGLEPGPMDKANFHGFWREEDTRRVLDVAYHRALASGLASVSCTSIGRECGVSANTVRKYVDGDLLGAVVRRAVSASNLGIIAQGLAMGVPAARAASDSLKDRALHLLK